jgi:hypothetical protein
MPDDSLAPVSLAVGLSLLFIGALLHAWWLAALGGTLCVAALLLWFWPRPRALESESAGG